MLTNSVHSAELYQVVDATPSDKVAVSRAVSRASGSNLSESIELVPEEANLSDDELSIEFVEHSDLEVDMSGSKASPNMYNSVFVEFTKSKCL